MLLSFIKDRTQSSNLALQRSAWLSDTTDLVQMLNSDRLHIILPISWGSSQKILCAIKKKNIFSSIKGSVILIFVLLLFKNKSESELRKKKRCVLAFILAKVHPVITFVFSSFSSND